MVYDTAEDLKLKIKGIISRNPFRIKRLTKLLENHISKGFFFNSNTKVLLQSIKLVSSGRK
jgi:hypothetical protein